MDFNELIELLQYIEKHHSWKTIFARHCEGDEPRTLIKYVNFDFDTRDCKIWRVSFRNVAGIEGNEISFKCGSNGTGLKEKIDNWFGETLKKDEEKKDPMMSITPRIVKSPF